MALSWIRSLSTLAAALLLGSPAFGLGLVADDRSVSNGGDSQQPGPFAPFHGSVFGASQDSAPTVSPDGLGLEDSIFMGASGFLVEIFDPETGGTIVVHVQGTSRYSITFQIHGDGELALDGFARPLAGIGPVPSFLRVLSGMDVLYESLWGNTATFDFATDLSPGLYTLEAQLGPASFDNDMFLELTFQVRDTVVPIPEPVVALLLGLAALALRDQRGRGTATQRPVPRQAVGRLAGRASAASRQASQTASA